MKFTPLVPRFCQLLAVLLLIILTEQAELQSAELPPHSRVNSLSDAALHDVHFADALHGWAVGDRGVIWRTQDGGEHWQLSDCPVTCRLTSVQFVNKSTGWAVGGWHHAGSALTGGVVLFTTNGGRSWSRIDDGTLPNLNEIRMLSFEQGWAIGNGSHLHASGVFRTRDGGKTWTTVGGSTSTAWTAMGVSQSKVILGGLTGRLGSVETDVVRTELFPPKPSRVNQINMTSATDGWLVGDDGLLLQTRTAGAGWNHPLSGPLATAPVAFNWNCIDQHETTIWVAGNPGSMILKSADGGENWHRLYTQSPTPINAISFLNEKIGFAVGELGRILATRDGGNTWRTLRYGANRLALSVVCDTTEEIPFELLAEQAANRGYISAVAAIGLSEDAAITDSDRTRSAVIHVGATSFSKLMNDRISDEYFASQGREKVIQRVTQHIQTWRPEVLVIGSSDDSTELREIIFAAIERAAIESHQNQTLGLYSWNVNKVYEHRPISGSVTLRAEQVAPALSDTLSGYSSYAKWVNDPSGIRGNPEKLHFELLRNETTAEPIQLVSRRGMMTGLSYLKGDRIRRESDSQVTILGNSTLQSIRYRTTVDRIIANSFANNDVQTLIGDLSQILNGLDQSAAIDRICRLAIQLEKQNEHMHAMRVNRIILSQYAGHPATEQAYLSLIRMFTSSELMMQLAKLEDGHNRMMQGSGNTSQIQRASASVEVEPSNGATGQLRIGGGDVSVDKYLEQFQLIERDFCKEAMDVLSHMKKNLPELSMDPRVRVPLLRTQQKVGAMDNASKYLRIWQSRHLFNPVDPESRNSEWFQAVIYESGIRNSFKSNMGPVTPATFTTERPNLDGTLSESIWLESSTESSDERVMFRWDDEFLIIGIECAKKDGEVYGPVATSRAYDQDLSDADRISLEFDSDRDYQTFQKLEVDHRGRCTDSRLGDFSWNPKWFIAADQNETTWTVECAIAWKELAMRRPRRGDAWALRVTRLSPSEKTIKVKSNLSLLHVR